MATDNGSFGGGPDAINLIVNAIDNASAKLTEINQSLDVMNRSVGETAPAAKESESSMIELNQALEVGRKAIEMVSKAYEMTIGSTLEYGDTVRQVSAELGLSTEETSRLINATDKFGISTSALTMAQKTLAKEGLSLSIETLKQLADEYNKLGTQSEKTEFLVKNLGRSGMQMADMFDMGSAAIDKFANSTEASMILTQEQSDELRDYSIQIKTIQDAWQGVANSITFAVLPSLEKGAPIVQDFLDKFSQGVQDGGIMRGISLWNLFGSAAGAATDAIKGETGAVNEATVAHQQLIGPVETSTDQLVELGKTYTEDISLAEHIASQTTTFSNTQATLADKLQVVNKELIASQGVYQQTGKHVTDLKTQQADLVRQYEDSAAKNQEATQKQAYSDYIKLQSSKEMTTALFQQEQQMGVALGVFTQGEADTAVKMRALEEAAAAGKLSANEFADALKHLNDVQTQGSGQQIAMDWQKNHPQTTQNAQQGPQTGQDVAQQRQDAQKIASQAQQTTQTLASAATSSVTNLTNTVTTQSNKAADAVNKVLENLTKLSGQNFTISVTTTTNAGASGVGNTYP